jgi:hypothetical protein
MFVKVENFWLNTEHIVTFEPQGKAFRINLSNGAFLVLQLKDYLRLIKAMSIKRPLKAVKEKKVVPDKPDIPEKSAVEKPIPEISPAVTDKTNPKRVAIKGTVKAKTLKEEKGEGASGGVPKKKVVIKPEAKK